MIDDNNNNSDNSNDTKYVCKTNEGETFRLSSGVVVRLVESCWLFLDCGLLGEGFRSSSGIAECWECLPFLDDSGLVGEYDLLLLSDAVAFFGAECCKFLPFLSEGLIQVVGGCLR